MNAITQQLTAPVSRWLHRGRPEPGAATGFASQSVPGPEGTSARIRSRREDDLDSCARILRGISSGGKYPVPRPASHRQWLSEGIVDAWVAERRGLVLGHVAIARVGPDSSSAMRWREVTGHSVTDLADVSRFFVRMPERGRGLGGALLATAVSAAHTRGLLPVAEVVTGSRYGVPLYEHQGWRLAGQFPYGVKGDDRVHYLYVVPTGPRTR